MYYVHCIEWVWYPLNNIYSQKRERSLEDTRAHAHTHTHTRTCAHAHTHALCTRARDMQDVRGDTYKTILIIDYPLARTTHKDERSSLLTPCSHTLSLSFLSRSTHAHARMHARTHSTTLAVLWSNKFHHLLHHARQRTTYSSGTITSKFT